MSDRKAALTTGTRLLAAAPVALTLLPLWRTGRGWVRIWDFPRTQIAGLGILAAAAVRRFTPGTVVDRALQAALLGSVIYQAAKILPYTPAHRTQVPAAGRRTRSRDRNIRLLMSNVLQSNRRFDLVLNAVEAADADVICLVETDDWWEQKMRVLRDHYDFVQACPLNNTYGMILYSRLPVVDCETRFLVSPDIPSMRAVVQLRSGDEVVLYALHPRPPLPGSPSYGRDAELVLTGRQVAQERKPALVIGDLNDVAWSYTTTLFQRVSHMLDPRIGRGLFNTFHARHSLARYPLDHVFHTRHFTVAGIRRLGYTGSDHFPICVELEYSPERKEETPYPKPDAEDIENAEDILEDAADAGVLKEGNRGSS